MNLVETIESDPYVSGLEERSQIAQTFFDGLTHSFESDLSMAEKYKSQSAQFGNFFGPAFDGLEIKLDVERGETIHKLSTLKLSSAFAEIRVFANHPPGWLFLQVSKRSAMYEGILHYGVIEVVLHAQKDRPYDLNFTRCGWLWLEGMPDREKLRPRLIAEILWKHVMTPEVPAQLEEVSKKAEK
ncbi:MAG: hypothetical protein WCA11_16270 [Terracidiphilus sp.]